MRTLEQLKNISDETYIKHALHFRDDTISMLEQRDKTILKLRRNIAEIDSVKTQLKDMKKAMRQLNKINTHLECRNKYLEQKEKDLENEVEDVTREKDEIQELLKEAAKRISELEKRVTELTKEEYGVDDESKKSHPNVRQTDSSNSNYPSSHDCFSKPSHKKKTSQRKRGGQKGHAVHRLELSQHCDNITKKFVTKAPRGAVLVEGENNERYYVVQEIDVTLKTIINETHYYITDNGEELDEYTMNKFRINSVVYSEHFKAVALYLNCMGVIALDRLCKMLNETSNGQITVKPGTIVKWSKEFAKKTQPFRSAVLARLLNSKVLHVDETSIRVNGKNYWLHVLTDGKDVYTVVTEDRGGKEGGVVPILRAMYKGILVHDHWCTYLDLEGMTHAECNAHILRALKYGIDFENSEACVKLEKLLIEALKKVEEFKAQGLQSLPDDEYNKLESEFLRIVRTELQQYYKEHEGIALRDEEDHIKLFKRLNAFHNDHLLFLKDFDVPFTNNNAENPIRFTKTKQKVSGQFYSLNTAKDYNALLSMIQTTSRNKQNVLEQIEDIMKS